SLLEEGGANIRTVSGPCNKPRCGGFFGFPAGGAQITHPSHARGNGDGELSEPASWHGWRATAGRRARDSAPRRPPTRPAPRLLGDADAALFASQALFFSTPTPSQEKKRGSSARCTSGMNS